MAHADVVITTYGTAVRDIDALETIQWDRLVLDEAQAIKNPASETAQQLRRIEARARVALTGTPIENGLGDLWAILDFTNPGLVGARPQFIAQLSVKDRADAGNGAAAPARAQGEDALRALNGILVFRRTKAEPSIAAELPDRIDELDHCAMTPEQIGLYQAVLDKLVTGAATDDDLEARKGAGPRRHHRAQADLQPPGRVTSDDDRPLDGRSGKLARLEEIVDSVFAAGEKVLIFTHFAEWGEQAGRAPDRPHAAPRSSATTAALSRGARDKIISDFQGGEGPRRPRAVAQGRRHRPQPDRRQPRRALRPLVEPRRRGPGP